MFQTYEIRAAVTSGSATTTIRDGQTVLFTSSNIGRGTGLEVRIQIPHGVITAKPSPWQIAEDKLRTPEEKLRIVEDQLRISEEQRRTVEDKLRTSEEQLRTIGDKLNTSEEQRRTVENNLRTSEEERRTLEGQLNNLQSAFITLAIVAGLAVVVAFSVGLGLLWIAVHKRNRTHGTA